MSDEDVRLGPAAAGFFPVVPGDAHLPGPPEAWQVRRYSQLLRGPNHAWWRPLLSAAVVGAWLFAMVVVFGVAMATAMAMSGSLGPAGELREDQLQEWGVSPSGLLLTNLMLAMLIPVAQSAVWAGHGWRPRWVASVAGGVRWAWLMRCYATALLVLLLVNVVLVVLDGGLGQLSPEPQAGLYVLVVLLTTPLQAAGEEYLFRGWLSQAVGSWFAGAALGAVAAAVVSGLLFAFAHGQQNPWLFADRFLFSLAASWLVWRTGGLEASIALHGAFNLLAFAAALLTGQLSATVTATEATPLMVGVDLVIMVVSAVALARLARRYGVLNRFRPPGVA